MNSKKQQHLKPRSDTFAGMCAEPVLSEWPFFQFSKRNAGDAQAWPRQADEHAPYWQLIPDSEYGCPREAAFRLHTFLIVPHIYESYPEIPEVIELGTATSLCVSMGITDSGHNLNKIRMALGQLTATMVRSNLTYPAAGEQRSLTCDFRRYQQVPGSSDTSGRLRDRIRLRLTAGYRDLLSAVRPEFFDAPYAAAFRPGAQRFYQLAGPQIRQCIDAGGEARISYSDYCRRAPQARYRERDAVQKQMYKLHAPHVESGYLAPKIRYAPVGCGDTRDWIIAYLPGPAARAEHARARAWLSAGSQLALSAHG